MIRALTLALVLLAAATAAQTARLWTAQDAAEQAARRAETAEAESAAREADMARYAAAQARAEAARRTAEATALAAADIIADIKERPDAIDPVPAALAAALERLRRTRDDRHPPDRAPGAR